MLFIHHLSFKQLSKSYEVARTLNLEEDFLNMLKQEMKRRSTNFKIRRKWTNGVPTDDPINAKRVHTRLINLLA
ncbi:sporulation histidine kinase inhibitor Sda [Salirhabdus euzebyi]|uniref:sporulation histidine kinase inhibitor Sda n=1 Tax=Salirhabdus euzebyi TaxID=394506 RepID=UPI00157A4A63|nr:sporulation histidine kinase inhibitor Sda [Salirhabdus euzebyi]